MPNLLIIDDQPTLLSALRQAFEDEWEIRCTQSGEEALGIMASWQPDVVITDYAMPGMTGLDFIRAVREYKGKGTACRAPTKVKIILISAKMDWELKRQALAAGADVCLAKPFDLWELYNCIR